VEFSSTIDLDFLNLHQLLT